MAISNDLNSIRTHLEDDYTALEQLGVSVEDRNIENIKDMANQIYAKFPKTSYAEGSNITLSNTLKGKLDFEDGIVGYGDTKQESTNGYQLLSSEKANQSSSLSVTYISGARYNCKTTSSGNQLIFTGIGLPSGNYVVSIQVTRGTYSGGNFVVRNSSNSVIGEGAINGTNRLNITISNNDINSLLLWGASANLDFDFDIQISSGTTAQNFEPYTNGASPNPSYPQDIEVVRGKNRLKLENGTTTMHNVTSVTENGKITLNGTPNSTDYISLIGTYVASTTDIFTLTPFKSATNSDIRLLYTINDGSLVNSDNTPQINLTIGDILKVYLRISSTSQITNFTLQPQLEKGSQATSYLPYNTLEVVERGKNLFNPDVTGLFKFGCNATESNGEITITATQNGDIYVGNARASGDSYETQRGVKIPVKPNTQYTVTSTNSSINKIIITEYNSNDISLGYIQNTTITTKANTSYITVRYGLENAVNGTSYKTKIMVAEGTDSTYEPYQTPQTYQLSLGEYEFAKIGNYVDTIEYDVDEDKVYFNKPIRKKVLNGGSDENWAYETAYNRFGLTETINDYNITLRTTAICNYYRYGDTSIDNYFALSSNGKLALFHAPTNISTLAEWKTWLSTNNLILYYILATATKTEITGTLKDQIKALYYSHSFTGTTILEVDGDLPMIIKARALKGE